MKLINIFDDYKILDMADGKKIEKWGNVILNRPDPQVIWNKKTNKEVWDKVDATYNRSDKGGGNWTIHTKNVKDSWIVSYKDLKFNLKLMGFKHTGLFPEQSINWDLLMDTIKNENREIKVLNLFAYTGASSIACLKAGANVTHVDSSKGMIDWAKENVKLNNLENKPIRFLVDDCVKFVEREIRRENKYDIIIMDPPSFGRGTKGEIWDIEKNLYDLVEKCSLLLSDNPLLFLINSYSTNLSKILIENTLKLTINKKDSGIIESYELCIPMENSELILPCGVTTIWKNTK